MLFRSKQPYRMDFYDQDLATTVDFEKGFPTPRRTHGRDGMIYWRDCEVILMKLVDDELETIRKVQRRTGQGLLKSGLTLVFFGEGGRIVEE